jgi:hypothetical protein
MTIRDVSHGFVYLRDLGVFATFAPNDASFGAARAQVDGGVTAAAIEEAMASAAGVDASDRATEFGRLITSSTRIETMLREFITLSRRRIPN